MKPCGTRRSTRAASRSATAVIMVGVEDTRCDNCSADRSAPSPYSVQRTLSGTYELPPMNVPPPNYNYQHQRVPHHPMHESVQVKMKDMAIHSDNDDDEMTDAERQRLLDRERREAFDREQAIARARLRPKPSGNVDNEHARVTAVNRQYSKQQPRQTDERRWLCACSATCR